MDAGNVKWILGKQTDNSFFLYDNVGSKNFLIAATGGNMVLGSNQTFTIASTGTMNVTVPNATGAGITIQNVSGTTTYTAFQFDTNGSGTAVGNISVTSVATVYNTTSDRNIKTNFAPLPTANTDGNIIDQLQPQMWNYAKIYDPEQSIGVGFVAQELAPIIPLAVTPGSITGAYGDKDYVLWQVDLSKIVPHIVADLQDVHKKLEAAYNAIDFLQSQIAAINAKIGTTS